jgi:pyruvate dehydrogenase E1 component alpha subunit
VVTFRHYGHVDWREDIDVGVNRSASEVKKWKSRDPIERLKSALVKNSLLNQDDLKNIYQNIDSEIENAWSTAVSDPFPVTEDLLRTVYKEVHK